jgi:hypothetical protein
MNEATSLVNTEIPRIFNTFLPNFQPPKAAPPRPSLFGDILEIVKGLAAFTPFGPAVNLAIGVTQVFTDGILGDVPQVTKDVNGLSGLTGKLNMGSGASGVENVDTLTAKELKKAKAAVVKSRKQVQDRIGNVASLAGGVMKLIVDATATVPGATDAKRTPELPVHFAALSQHFGEMFGAIAKNLDAQFAAALVQTPGNDDTGYLQMVTGGLYSLDPSSQATIKASSPSNMMTRYLAFFEDEMLKLILSKWRF